MGGGWSIPVPSPIPPSPSAGQCAQTQWNTNWVNYTTGQQIKQNLAFPNQQALVIELTGQVASCQQADQNKKVLIYDICNNIIPAEQQVIDGQEKTINSLEYQNLKAEYNYYQTIGQQNQIISNNVDALSQSYITNNQKVNYENGQIEQLNSVNYFLGWIYWGLVIILLGQLIFLSNMSQSMKIIVAIIVILYPLFIYLAEKSLYFVYKYLNSMVMGMPYRSE
jgi:hypothetical protein